MSMDIDAVSGCQEFDYFSEMWDSDESNNEHSFHTAIYSNPHLFVGFVCKPFTHPITSSEDQKIKSTFQNVFRALMTAHAGGSVEGGVSISWGGKDGTTIEGYTEVDIYDDKGNHVDIRVSQDSNGQGNLDASARHDSDDKSSGRHK